MQEAAYGATLLLLLMPDGVREGKNALKNHFEDNNWKIKTKQNCDA